MVASRREATAIHQRPIPFLGCAAHLHGCQHHGLMCRFPQGRRLHSRHALYALIRARGLQCGGLRVQGTGSTN